MGKPSGAMHVARIKSRHVNKAGETKVYESVLLRRSFRDSGTVKHDTLANLSALPAHVIDLIDASLKGTAFIPAAQQATIAHSRPHGHVAAVWAMARRLGLPQLLGPAGRQRDLALALIISRVVRPKPKLSTIGWWNDVTLGGDLGVAGAGTDEVYAAMDWLVARQDAIEAELARRHLGNGALALFDLSSSWMEGTGCELAARGHSRDGKRGKAQIEYGLLTDAVGRPVAIRVFPGNTADPTAFITATHLVTDTFALDKVVMVGDRGMITSARIRTLKDIGGLDWITCLRAPAIAKLAADDGPLQLSLFDTADLAQITHPDYPGERLIACRNPHLAAERARKRADLLAATQTLLDKIATQVEQGRLSGADAIGVKLGKQINKYKVGKHFTCHITDTAFTYTREVEKIEAEAALDGIYIVRTSVGADRLDAPGVVSAYKNLAVVERDFRSIKADDVDLRPIHHRLTERVRGHVLICMLAAYLTWHLRRVLAPLTFTDTQPPTRDNPVAPARRSAHAKAKAQSKTDEHGHPLRSFRDLLDHLATLTRNDLRYGDTLPLVPTLADPTPTQRRVFELLKTPIPITLT
jgi:hypothetical protein